jgi:Mg-chelatase subunit ChlI
VDVLLDAAAMGVNVVEREGISVWHPSRFILVGTMNPEEGELRPQLLDRFGLCVDVEGIKEIDQRVEIVERRERWELDPRKFLAAYRGQDAEIGHRIKVAVRTIDRVEVPRVILTAIAELNVNLQVDGHRADLVARKSAQALAAYQGLPRVHVGQVNQVLDMVLAHRVKRAGQRQLAEAGSMLSALASAE